MKIDYKLKIFITIKIKKIENTYNKSLKVKRNYCKN